MAKLSNKPIGVIPDEVEELVEVHDKVPELKIPKPIPTAKVEIRPPFFGKQAIQLTPQEEYEEALNIIQEGKINGLLKVVINHDLQDLAWQKLSQAGYKLSRKVLPRLYNTNPNACELDSGRVQFEISLTDFNRVDC